jgi:hypothetical protein
VGDLKGVVLDAVTVIEPQDSEHVGTQLASSPTPSASHHQAARRAVDCTGHRLTVYNGAVRLGSLVERDSGFDAYDVAGNLIGSFSNQRDAARALPDQKSAADAISARRAS